MLTIRDRPNLCDLCQGLTIPQLVLPRYYRHAESRRALRTSAATCELCALISYRLDHGAGRHSDHSLGTRQEPPMPSSFDKAGENWRGEPSSSIKLAFVPEYDPETHNQEPPLTARSGFTEVGIWRYSKYRVSGFHVAVEDGDVLGSPDYNSSDHGNVFFQGRTIVSSEIPSEALFDVVRDWLNTCEHSPNHSASRCKTSFGNDQDPPLPTRIVSVGRDGSEPRLVCSVSNQRGRYVALSHCWGGIQPVQTKRGDGSLERYIKHGIPMASLPKTFRDAVIITRKLGIHYLWIDSLCIIQDDEKDWQRESGRMSTLYWNSTLTISATGAKDSTEGCFLPEANGDAVALPQTFSKRGGKLYALRHQYNLGAKQRWHYKVMNGSVMARAWMLQERWLSGKILHCCTGQWFWECCESKRAQDGFEEETHPTPQDFRSFSQSSKSFRSKLDVFKRAFGGVYEVQETPDRAARRRRIDLRPDTDDVSDPDQAVIVVTKESDGPLFLFLRDICRNRTRYTHWYRDFVSAFSKCNLTKAEDKLPALAGIASAVHDIVQDTYLAGHWRQDLVPSLLWYTPKTSKPILGTHVSRRPAKYRAPSWAWASVDGEVKWYPVKGSLDLKIVEVATELAQAENPFGQVKNGLLVVTGRTASAQWDGSEKRWRFKSSLGDWTIDPTEQAFLGLNIFDEDANDIGTVTFDNALNTMVPNIVGRAGSGEEELKEQGLQFEGYAVDAAQSFKLLPTELRLLLVGSSSASSVVSPARTKGTSRTSSNTSVREPNREAISTSYALLLSPVVDGADKRFVRVGAAVLYSYSWEDFRWIEETLTII